MTGCSFAACDRPGTSAADGFRFCAWHLRLHRVLQVEALSTPARTGVDTGTSPVAHLPVGPFAGQLLPSRSLRAVRDVLTRQTRKEGAA